MRARIGPRHGDYARISQFVALLQWIAAAGADLLRSHRVPSMRLGSNESAEKTVPAPGRIWRAASCFCMCAVLFALGCRSNQSGGEEAAQTAAPPSPTVPAEYVAGAKIYLGPSAEVLAFGDLALNGGDQILVADPMPGAQANSSPGILIVRAVVLEKQGDTWKEIFRCDERLTNEKGFLTGTPTSPVSGWRMEYRQDYANGLELKFTEAASDPNHSATYLVRWNQKVERYQSLDKTGDRFFGELPATDEPVPRDLQK